MIDDDKKSNEKSEYEKLLDRKKTRDDKVKRAEIDRIIKLASEGATYLKIFCLTKTETELNGGKDNLSHIKRIVTKAYRALSKITHPDGNSGYDAPHKDADHPNHMRATQASKILNNIKVALNEQFENEEFEDLGGNYEMTAKQKFLAESIKSLYEMQDDYIKRAKRSFFNKPNSKRIDTINKVKLLVQDIKDNKNLTAEEKIVLIVGCVKNHKRSVTTHHKKRGFMAKIGLRKLQGKSRLDKTFDKWLEAVKVKANVNNIKLHLSTKKFEKYSTSQTPRKHKSKKNNM